MTDFFKASYLGHPILRLLFEDTDPKHKSKGKVATLRAWELSAISHHRMTEDEWARLAYRERVRKIVSLHLGDWIQALDLRYNRV